jgi:hypothetical protein
VTSDKATSFVSIETNYGDRLLAILGLLRYPIFLLTSPTVVPLAHKDLSLPQLVDDLLRSVRFPDHANPPFPWMHSGEARQHCLAFLS